MSKYKNILRDAGIAYTERKLQLASTLYKTALDFIDNNHIQENEVNKEIMKYIISLTTLETKNMDDLNSAIVTLNALEKSLGSTFPAIYYAIGKANIIQYRFEAADEAIRKGFAALDRTVCLKRYNIPGTQMLMSESTKEGLFDLLKPLKEECSGWHQPDAICNTCHNFTQVPFVPKRNMFFGDPTFNGMVRTVCSNSTNPCKINFHPICWKIMKENLSPVKKLSDKDVIGYPCFTPNCENNSTISVIDRIEIIDENAEVKTVIEPTINIQPVKAVSVSKGAVRKQIVQPKQKRRFEKTKKPSVISAQTLPVKETFNYSRLDLEVKVVQLINLRENDFGLPFDQRWEPELGLYGNLNFDVSLNASTLPNYLNSEPGMDELHNFTFSLLYEYIVESEFVKVGDVLLKWGEAKSLIPASVSVVNNDIEIIEFLLQSSKVTMIGEYICSVEMLPNAYHLIKQETNGVLEFALNNSLNPDDPDLEGEDYDCLFNLIMQKDSADTVSVEPRLQNYERESVNMINQSIPNIDEEFKFHEIPVDDGVEDYNKNVCTSKPTDEESLCQGSERIHNTKHFDTEDEIKNKMIDELSLTVRGYFQDFEEQLEKKKIFNKSSSKVNLECSAATTGNFHNILINKSKLESNVTPNNFDGVLEEIKTMDDGIYKQCVEHIAYLNSQLQIVINKKNIAEQTVSQLYQEKGKIIDKFEAERKSLLEDVKAYSNLATATKDVQLRYESQMEDYTKLQQETLAALESEQELKRRFKECKQDNTKLTATVLDLRNHNDEISRELQCKSADLEREKESSLEWKKRLLRKFLNAQLQTNMCLLSGNIEQCNIALEVFSYVNTFLKNTFINIKLFPESGEWIKTLNDLKELQNSQEVEFSGLCELLNLKDEFNLTDVDELNFKRLVAPIKPSCSLAESVQMAFKVMHMNFLSMMPRIPNMPPPPPPQSMMHPPMDLQARYMPNQPVYLMNHGYQYPRNRMPYPSQHQVHPQPLMNLNFQRPPLPALNKVYNEQKSITPPLILNENEKQVDNNSKEDFVNSNDVNFSEVELEEKDDFSGALSSEGSTMSLSMKSEKSPTPPLNGLQLKQPKFGIDRVMEKLRSEFIGVPEFDLIQCIWDVRKMHNNSLSGIKTLDVLSEAKELILVRQQQHICDYNEKNGSTDLKEEKSKNTEVVEGKDAFHPFAFERLRKRNNSVSSTSSAGSIPLKIEPQPTKKSSMKPAWLPNKTNENNWTKEAPEVECVICLFPFDNTQNTKTKYTLKCQHSFHTECIKTWLQTNQSCPNCREHATHDEDFPPLP